MLRRGGRRRVLLLQDVQLRLKMPRQLQVVVRLVEQPLLTAGPGAGGSLRGRVAGVRLCRAAAAAGTARGRELAALRRPGLHVELVEPGCVSHRRRPVLIPLSQVAVMVYSARDGPK